MCPATPGRAPRCSHPGKILAQGLTETFVLIQEFFPSGFWVFGFAGKHPCAEQGEQGAWVQFARADVTLGICSPWMTSIPIAVVATRQGRSPWSLCSPPRMQWRIFLLIRICPCCSSCRRWETAAPWCDLRDGLHRWRQDGMSKPWVRLSHGELPPFSAPGPSALAGATPAAGMVPRCPMGLPQASPE